MAQKLDSYDYDDLVSVARAAKDVHRARSFVKQFAIDRGIYVQIGARMLIPVSELKRHLAAKKPPLVHPLVRC